MGSKSPNGFLSRVSVLTAVLLILLIGIQSINSKVREPVSCGLLISSLQILFSTQNSSIFSYFRDPKRDKKKEFPISCKKSCCYDNYQLVQMKQY